MTDPYAIEQRSAFMGLDRDAREAAAHSLKARTGELVDLLGALSLGRRAVDSRPSAVSPTRGRAPLRAVGAEGWQEF